MSNDKIKLFPCPFCDFDDIRFADVHGVVMMSEPEYKQAYCMNCGARTRKCYDEIEATEAWNRRPYYSHKKEQ